MAVENQIQRLLTELADARLQLRDHKQPDLDTAGGGSGGMSDDWKTSVDRQLTQLHGDVRNLLYGLIASFVLLAGGGWVIYDKTSDQMIALRIGQAEIGGKLNTIAAKIDANADGSVSMKADMGNSNETSIKRR